MSSKRMIKNLWNRMIRKTYYYVEPCPRCKSPVTGRFIRSHQERETEWTINEALRHGELVSPVQEIPVRNLFCASCGYRWMGEAKLKLLSVEELELEIENRCTGELLEHNYDIIKEREAELRKRHRFTNPIRRFIGPM